MRTFIFRTAALFAAVFFLSSPAFALSVDHESGMNTDGTAKFADPDEQMPNFMNPPADAPAGSQAQSSNALSLSPGGNNGLNFSVNRYGSNGPAPDAFEQDFKNK